MLQASPLYLVRKPSLCVPQMRVLCAWPKAHMELRLCNPKGGAALADP